MVRDARKLGLKAPVVLMGYYNPIRAYGEEKVVRDSKEAGVNGYIVVDLPPEEAVSFRKLCSNGGYDSHPPPTLSLLVEHVLLIVTPSCTDCRIFLSLLPLPRTPACASSASSPTRSYTSSRARA